MTNLNDAFMDALEDYSGAVNDRRKARLLEYLSETDGQLNDLEYKALGDLGYGGALNDRWDTYLKSLGGEGLSSLAELMGSTFYGFSPLALFRSGAQGTWYDPNDLNTMFINGGTLTSGALSTASIGSPVSLMLDKSKGAGYSGGAFTGTGTNIISNGTFDDDSTTGWVAGFGLVNGTFTASSGVATLTQGSSDTAPRFVTTLSGLTIGRSYVLQFTAAGQSGSGDKYVVWTSSASGTGGATYLQGGAPAWDGSTRQFVATATAATMYFAVGIVSGTTGSSVSIDNISVRELPGNHATQSVLAQRPILSREPASGRRNLLTYTEQFDNAAWSRTGTSLTANVAAAPDGTTTADKLIENAITATHFISQPQTLASGAYTITAYLKAAELDKAQLWFGVVNSGASFDLTAVTSSQITGFNNPDAHSIVDVGGGWRRCAVTYTLPSGASPTVSIYLSRTGDFADRNYAGDGTSGIFIWGAQLEAAASASAYQRVVTARDVTEAGQPDRYYLFCDGIDDGMVTSAIDFTATDEMSVFAGVRKLSDAATGVIAEFSADAGGNAGAFGLYAAFPANGYTMRSRGTSSADASSPTTFVSPISNVLTGIGDISGDVAAIRINGTQVAISAVNQGTGNFGNYPLYLFRRGGTTLPFSGHFYGGVILGRTATATEIANTERYLAGKTTGVTLA